uniref:Uncharacterized protein n=1 Tax=Arundo donax TaxID=35708 RepID=A0A0A8ZM61_ARUDO
MKGKCNSTCLCAHWTCYNRSCHPTDIHPSLDYANLTP